jgi:hypothetical protein
LKPEASVLQVPTAQGQQVTIPDTSRGSVGVAMTYYTNWARSLNNKFSFKNKQILNLRIQLYQQDNVL